MPVKGINGRVYNTLLHYVPHGINSNVFKPLGDTEPRVIAFKKQLFNDKKYDFVILYNSRNIKRKQTSNIILAYRMFCDNLTKEEAEKCLLVLHTEPRHEAGTDLVSCKEALCPNYDVQFSPGKLSPDDMCTLYNVADVTINVSSNEGFGLSTAESIMCGTPIIAAVTGGLQDQMGFVDENGDPIKFSRDFGSNNVGKYKKCGNWAYPIWPCTRNVQGSIPTPYIFDDMTTWEDAAVGMMHWYLVPKDLRTKFGAEGREWALGPGGLNAKNMGDQFITAMEYTFENFVPVKQFDVFTSEDFVGHKMPNNSMGFEMPVIDRSSILENIKKLKL